MLDWFSFDYFFSFLLEIFLIYLLQYSLSYFSNPKKGKMGWEVTMGKKGYTVARGWSPLLPMTRRHPLKLLYYYTVILYFTYLYLGCQHSRGNLTSWTSFLQDIFYCIFIGFIEMINHYAVLDFKENFFFIWTKIFSGASKIFQEYCAVKGPKFF